VSFLSRKLSKTRWLDRKDWLCMKNTENAVAAISPIVPRVLVGTQFANRAKGMYELFNTHMDSKDSRINHAMRPDD